MSPLIELLVQLVVQLVVGLGGAAAPQAGAYGAVRVLASRTGRYVVAGLAGVLAGSAWTRCVSGPFPVPRLLRVGLVLALAAGLLATGRAGAAPRAVLAVSRWRRAVAPPWSWSVERLVGLAVLDSRLAVGVIASLLARLTVSR